MEAANKPMRNTFNEQNTKSISLPLIWILGSSLLFSLVLYIFLYSHGVRAWVVLGTSLFAQHHFFLAYLFGLDSAARYMWGSRTLAIGVVIILISTTAFFYQTLLTIVSSFFGILAVLFYFYLHYYENILYFWEKTAKVSRRSNRSPVERLLFYGTLASATVFIFLPHAKNFGVKFENAAIHFTGIQPELYGASIALTVVLFILLWIKSAQKKIMTISCAGIIVLTWGLAWFGSFFLDFLGLVYLHVLWHFSMWNAFYVWKLWDRSQSFSLFPKKIHFRGLGFLHYARSGPAPFILFSILAAIPFVIYFALDYDRLRQTLLYHVFYGQFAMFIWAVPHITFSFLPFRSPA